MKNLSLIFLFLTFFALGCSGLDSLGLDDETAQAGELVKQANEDLREIRQLNKANAGKLEQLQQAMTDRDTPQVRKILDQLIEAVSKGLSYGETAIARIDQATEKKTNPTYNEYLRLKQEALRKQIDAFKFRRDVAKALRDKFGTEDQAEIDRAKTEFINKEEEFDKYWDVAERLNDDAERLRRENPTKIRAK